MLSLNISPYEMHQGCTNNKERCIESLAKESSRSFCVEGSIADMQMKWVNKSILRVQVDLLNCFHLISYPKKCLKKIHWLS